MTSYDTHAIGDLIDGTLPWPATKQMMSGYKDDTRFDTYLEVLQQRVPWPEEILLPIGEHLYIVKGAEGRVVKCDCGHEFGDYRENWKLQARIRVRDDQESIEEIYPGRFACDASWMELREFLCPGCLTLLEVEAAPPGFPVVFDFLPDLEALYQDWLGRPVP
ncbi:acetone carboxylase subunit gamma [Georgenia deserti]|uniref:Acetone carboxylase subunit gamma n=1 Tax=Georgenia deserti TaxID=2093781 RepID=A0ABW4L5K3_9MICO